MTEMMVIGLGRSFWHEMEMEMDDIEVIVEEV
jgi:hypothetical protein